MFNGLLDHGDLYENDVGGQYRSIYTNGEQLLTTLNDGVKQPLDIP